jgi:3-mercaptopyruvate sulfurtransferase SseA
MGDAVADH